MTSMLDDLITSDYQTASPAAFDVHGRLDHHAVLARLHGLSRPRAYREFGAPRRDSLPLTHPETVCVGVAPSILPADSP
jgi:hypothetical protein